MKKQVSLNDVDLELDNLLVKNPKEISSVIIKYKGQQLTMRSGKRSWSTVGHAKAALLSHFEHIQNLYVTQTDTTTVDIQGNVRPNYSRVNFSAKSKEFKEYLYSKVEFVELKH